LSRQDVLVPGRDVVDVQDVVALFAELLVVRREPHRLVVGLPIGAREDATDLPVAYVDALRANVLAQQRR
jgi:hypothetical protein